MHHPLPARLTTYVLFIMMLTTSCYAGDPSWSDADVILKRITPPVFPDKEFVITDFGARGDGTTDCTEAFRKAIDVCNTSGGGRVVVPEGTFLTGAIHLKSNVNLVITKNAIVRFSTLPTNYLPVVYTRFEGVELMNYSPLIYAYAQENIAVTGEGVLDGQASAENWWSWKGSRTAGWKQGMPNQLSARDSLLQLAESNVPVEKRLFGEGSYLRPVFFQPYKCKNILVSGVTFKDSPMWFLNPVLSENITIANVTTVGHGPNNDGCDPECSKDILIEGCTFDNGDDCIAIKSGRNTDGRRVNVPSENIVVRNCTMKDGHGGVVVGSEISGNVRNVFVEDCTMDSPHLDRALRFKTNSVRGGTIENVFARRLTVGQVADAVVKVNFYYEEGDTGPYTPSMRNLYVSDVTVKKGTYGFYIQGYERSPITNIHFDHCTFEGIEKGNVIEHIKDYSFDDVTINGTIFEYKGVKK